MLLVNGSENKSVFRKMRGVRQQADDAADSKQKILLYWR